MVFSPVFPPFSGPQNRNLLALRCRALEDTPQKFNMEPENDGIKPYCKYIIGYLPYQLVTLPETSSKFSPENGWLVQMYFLPKESPLQRGHF